MLFDGLLRDLKIGVRGLIRRPGFAMAAILTLALGIGANTAVFSVIQHVLLAPLPYREPDRAVVIWSKWRGFDKTWVSDAETIDYKTRVRAFSDAGAWSVTQVNLTGDGDPIRIGAAFVTPNLFTVLDTTPLAGRHFSDAEATATPTVAILSYGLWQRRFGGESVVGRSIQVNGVAREVIGVMPRDFQLPTDYVVDAEEPTQIWLPYLLTPDNRGSHGLHAAARLRDGVSVEQANAELKSLTETLTNEGQYPVAMQFSAFAVSTTDEAFAAVRPALGLVSGAVGFLLLIACANVANLLLVRADGRVREMALRCALGAERWRLVRQLLTEGAVLAGAAGLVGVGFAWAALRALVATEATALPRVSSVTLDLRVIGFATLLAVATLVIFALVPALRAARVSLVDAFKDGSPQTSAGQQRQRLRGALVVAELALAVMLLAGAGLMIRSLWNLTHIDLGFNPDRVLTMRLALPAAQYDTPEKVVGFYQQLLARVRGLPGVERAGLLRLLPLAAPIGDWGLAIEGYMPPPGVGSPGDWQVATAGGPEALGERLVTGRWLTDQDTDGAQDVALINEAMAQKYWSGQDPIGRRFRMGNDTRPWITVVGIVGNVRHNGVTSEIKAKFYRAHGQFHRSSGNPARNMTLVVKTAGDPLALVGTVRREVRELDGTLPIAAIRPMQEVVDTSIATPRLTGWLLGVFASLALALAAVGVYGVLSYVVSHRRQEIGVRIAMGAGPSRVLGLVLRGGLALAVGGVALGLALAAAGTRLVGALLHGVEPLDPLTFVVAPAILLVVAIGASLIPAWRATRVDPAQVMK
ncbi:MAG TPA: ABC transporter permease [Vicinamibacterales bacterium]|nr:ABC transporter permease [Vicinamibacterales bacterium]